MSIRLRSAIVFMGLSMLLLLGTLGYIRYSQEHSRRAEFFDRLRDHCLRIARLLEDVERSDRELLRALDVNSIHRLFDEKVLVFDGKDQVIYSSLDDEPIPYSVELLKDLRAGGVLAFRDPDGDEVVGIHYTEKNSDLVVLASANDKFGQRELENLDRTLLISLVLGSIFIFGAGYLYIGMIFKPLKELDSAIASIDVDKLDQRLRVGRGTDELGRLATNYNGMLDRLRSAFDLQRAFVNNASHELRTPLARMNAQVERAQRLPADSPELQKVLTTLKNDIVAQGSLVESLLLLQRLQAHIPAHRSSVRVDEALFSTLEEAGAMHPSLRADVDVAVDITDTAQLTVSINELLLRTCFRNLITNAAAYATDNHVHVHLEPGPGLVRAVFTNAGSEALPLERVFEPFFRGAHPGRIKGNGLGLSIVQQVIANAGGQVHYAHDGTHRFTLELPTA